MGDFLWRGFAQHEACVPRARCSVTLTTALVGAAFVISPDHVTANGAAHGTPPPKPAVTVVVDMDPTLPGIQSSVTIDTCTTVVCDIAVYVVDPLGSREIYTIGYAGGIDRGITFGHASSPRNVGAVRSIIGEAGVPVNPGNVPSVVPTQWVDPGFPGPEVQYIECCAEQSAVISAEPAGPIFTVEVTVDGAMPGDLYSFHLLDFVSIWQPGAGVFSTQHPLPLTLDTGGDATPDQTPSIAGLDADAAVSVPPGAFTVDYIDGPVGGGGAMIAVTARPGDLNADGIVSAADLLILLGDWGPCGDPENCSADLNGDETVDVLDLLMLLGGWGGCPR